MPHFAAEGNRRAAAYSHAGSSGDKGAGMDKLLDKITDAEPATWLWWAAGALLALAVTAAIAEHRRRRRPNLDRVGWVPWDLIQVLAFLGAVVAAALALKL